MLQYTVDRRVEAVLLTLILLSMIAFMFFRPQNCNELEIINELLLNKSRIFERQTPQVAAPVASDEDFVRFFPTDASSIQKSIDQMDDAEMLQYMHWSDRASCNLRYNFGGVQVIYNDTTGVDGQKAVCMDRGVRPMAGKCTVYSFSRVKDWSFDVLMEKYGCKVYAMDEREWKSRTVTTIYEVLFNYMSKLTIISILISYFDCQMLDPLHSEMPVDILRADIEGAEFDAIPMLIESGLLNKVKQISLEVHFNKEKLRDNLKVIKALEDKGFVRFAIRTNIFWPTEINKLTDHFLYEMAWYNIKYKTPNPIA
jgi:hypothetical protein